MDWGGARDGGLQSDQALLTWNVRGIVSIGLMCLPVCYLCPEGREPIGCVLTMLVVLANSSSHIASSVWGGMGCGAYSPKTCVSREKGILKSLASFTIWASLAHQNDLQCSPHNSFNSLIEG